MLMIKTCEMLKGADGCTRRDVQLLHNWISPPASELAGGRDEDRENVW